MGRFMILLAGFLTVTPALAADAAILHLPGGDFLPGRIRASSEPRHLRWECRYFAEPFQFPPNVVQSIRYPLPKERPSPVGDFCLELDGDDVLFGDLAGVTDQVIHLNTKRFGAVGVKRASVRRMYRWKGADLVYLGPNGLGEWEDSSATRLWRDEGGHLVSKKPEASLFADLGLPEKAIIEVEISWPDVTADFVLALGVDEKPQSVAQAFRFEVWDGFLVAVGETEREADVAAVQPVWQGAGRVHLRAYLDQGKQTMTVVSQTGKLMRLAIASKLAQVMPGVRLTNNGKGVRLERMRISRWNGKILPQAKLDRSQVHRADGTVVYGELTGFDAKSNQLLIRADDEIQRLNADDAVDVMLLKPSKTDNAVDEKSDDPQLWRATYLDGVRVRGSVESVGDDHLTFACPNISVPLRLPLAALRSIVALSLNKNSVASSGDARRGRLEMDELKLNGRMVSSKNSAGCLAWRSDWSLNASALKNGVAGRVVYREAPVRSKPVHPQRRAIPRKPAGFGGIFINRLLAKPKAPSPRPIQQGVLHLRSGDTIPCTISRIDEKGVHFTTPISDATFAPHDEIKAAQLLASKGPPELAEPERDRLLTLPRLLRDTPPTHLICSTDGDFLRGRIVSMDEATLKIEVRLETQTVDREFVNQIIWLHADELNEEGESPNRVAAPSDVMRVQTRRADGQRLTFVVEKLDGQTLIGSSSLLGKCNATLTEIDQLILGPRIDEMAAELVYHRWKLHHASDPKFVQADGQSSGESMPGTSSPLVGNPAPEVKLKTLDGEPFRLSQRKGSVVVLDFWATWCGPCLQTMPVIERVCKDFEGKVELYAVNLEEQPNQIKATLERHQLDVAVLLDRDGAASARYAVTAIPQTVVIDRDGNVARLFIGGGSKLEEPLRAALEELTGPEPKSE